MESGLIHIRYPRMLTSLIKIRTMTGLDNLIEFVLGFDPLNDESEVFPVELGTKDSPTFEYSRTKSTTSETTQIFQYSDNLVNWIDIDIDGILPEISVSDGDLGMEDVVISLNTIYSIDGQFFGRIFVDLIE